MDRSTHILLMFVALACAFNGAMAAVVALNMGYYSLVPFSAIVTVIGVMAFMDLRNWGVDKDQDDE